MADTLMRQFIRQQIEEYCTEKGIELNEKQMRGAMNGVEFCLSEVMIDSVSIAVDLEQE